MRVLPLIRLLGKGLHADRNILILVKILAGDRCVTISLTSPYWQKEDILERVTRSMSRPTLKVWILSDKLLSIRFILVHIPTSIMVESQFPYASPILGVLTFKICNHLSNKWQFLIVVLPPISFLKISASILLC